MMSDLMLIGALRMPVTPQSDELTLMQYIDRGRQAADLIEQQQQRIEELEAQGLTKREQFAMAAMQGLTSSPLETDKLSHAANKSMKMFVVEQAVVIADALLAKLDKDGGER